MPWGVLGILGNFSLKMRNISSGNSPWILDSSPAHRLPPLPGLCCSTPVKFPEGVSECLWGYICLHIPRVSILFGKVGNWAPVDFQKGDLATLASDQADLYWELNSLRETHFSTSTQLARNFPWCLKAHCFATSSALLCIYASAWIETATIKDRGMPAIYSHFVGFEMLICAILFLWDLI